MRRNLFSDYLANKILDHIFGGASYTKPVNLFLAAFTTIPTTANAGGVEVSGGSYARKSIVNDNTSFAAAASRAKASNADITFDPATASWGTVRGYGLFDASSGGNLIAVSYAMGAPMVVTANASTDVFTATAHGFVDGQKVALFAETGTAVPGGLAEYTDYYVRDTTANTFKLAATAGGSAIDITDAGVGTIWIGPSYTRAIDAGDQLRIGSGSLVFRMYS